jgi:hypothetical protein
MKVKIFSKNYTDINLNSYNNTYPKRKHKTSVMPFVQTDFSSRHIEHSWGNYSNKRNQETDEKN